MTDLAAIVIAGGCGLLFGLLLAAATLWEEWDD